MDARDHILTISNGFIASQALLAADGLGVFAALAGGPRALPELAGELGLPEGPLERLLIACASIDLLRRQGARFELTEGARAHLVPDQPGYLGAMFGVLREFYYPLSVHLIEAVRSGEAQWSKLPAMQRDYYGSVYQDQARLRTFMRGMSGLTEEFAREAVLRFDFSRFERIVDLGGAPGVFLAAVCEKNPAVSGTVFDLPALAGITDETIARRGLSARVGFHPGDFFSDPLPPADLYALGYVLHNWSRDRGLALLRSIHAALPAHGAVFIAEALFDAGKDGPFWTARSNLVMLLATGAGEERTPAEYAALLAEAGFPRSEHQVCRTPKSFVVGWKGAR